jgi:hypothetical protein
VSLKPIVISKSMFTPASEIKGGPQSVKSSDIKKSHVRNTSTELP